MSIRIKRRWILAISCLIISGCTEKTIVREVPVASSPEASLPDTGVPDSGIPPTPGEGSNMVSGEVTIDSENEIEVDADQLEDQLEEPLSSEESDDRLSQTPDSLPPEQEAADGTSSDNVDCEKALPCRWVSEDAQFTVTITNADNIGTNDQLQLDYSISTVHDTKISVTGGGLAVDGLEVQLQPGEQRLGSSVSGNEQTLLAGTDLNGKIVFDLATMSSTLSEWSIIMLDGGIARRPAFSNIPVGPITNDLADCQLILPCTWMTPQGDVTVTLTSAGGFASNSSLSTTFSVQSTTTINVALEAGALAISNKGIQFAGRTHTLGGKRSYKKITAEAYAGYDLTGAIEYYQENEVPTELNELSLVLYQDDPVPRWNPKFINVPVQ